MAFSGYLIKVAKSSTATKATLPLKYIQAKSYKVIPNRRQDLDSYRDANGNLKRNVLSHTASTISFQTKPMNNTDMENFMSIIRNHYSVTKEKKIFLEYWCPDTNSYSTGYFYVPDVEYNIDLVRSNSLVYYPTTIEFIEY